MQDICFIDKTFDQEQTNLYHLSIQISLDGFSFAILDIPKGKYIVLKSFSLFLKRPRLLFMKIRDIFNREECLNLVYKSVEIAYSTASFTLVPQVLYHPGQAEKYFSFNQESEKGFLLERTLMSHAEAWCLFAMPENLRDFLMLKFPKATLRHNFYPLVEKALRDNKNHPGKAQVHLNFFRTSFEIVVIQGPNLLLCNQFSYSCDNDVLYFVLLVFDQLKLSPETTDLVFHGWFGHADAMFQSFKKYIRKTILAVPTPVYSYSYTFSQVSDHCFTSLFDLYKCE